MGELLFTRARLPSLMFPAVTLKASPQMPLHIALSPAVHALALEVAQVAPREQITFER